MRKRKSKEEMILENNIRSGFYKSEFRVKDAQKEVEKYILSKKVKISTYYIALFSFCLLQTAQNTCIRLG